MGIQTEHADVQQVRVLRGKYGKTSRHNGWKSGKEEVFSDEPQDICRTCKYPEYTSVKATVAELKQQNSYFINALYTDEDDGG